MNHGHGSHGLAPSKSTVYLSNIPFDLKNNDLHKIFEKHGKIVKVTVLKDKITRKSKGVAFILFLTKEDAKACAQATDGHEMFGRTLKASIAKDNGRSTEFIKRKEYPDKSKCYECGESGHLSYACTKNLLGDRDPPPKKVRKRKKKDDKDKTGQAVDYGGSEDEMYDEVNKGEEEYISDDETLSAAIALEQEKQEVQNYRSKVASGSYEENSSVEVPNRKRIRRSSYFSDEEEVE